jgi:replicative DNA helicase
MTTFDEAAGARSESTLEAPPIGGAPPITDEPFEPPKGLARLLPLGDLLGELLDEAEADHAAKLSGTPRGPVTGFPLLDLDLGGRLMPGYHVLHGNTAAGKTGLALQVAAQCGCPALFVTCEMSPIELFRRVIARTANVFLHDLKNGVFTRQAFAEKAGAALKTCPQLALVDATRAHVTADEIGLAAEIWREHHKAEHILLCLDSLHAWARRSATFREEGEYEGLGVAIGELQLLAAELAAPILVINERNRGSAAGGGVNAAAGHRAIEYGAETVLSLNRETIKDNKGNDTHRPKPFDARGEVGAYIAIEKNRHGAGGRFEMTYCGRLQKFSEA